MLSCALSRHLLTAQKAEVVYADMTGSITGSMTGSMMGSMTGSMTGSMKQGP